MAIPFTCENCGRSGTARDELAGRIVKCPGCSKPLSIQDKGSPPPFLEPLRMPSRARDQDLPASESAQPVEKLAEGESNETARTKLLRIVRANRREIVAAIFLLTAAIVLARSCEILASLEAHLGTIVSKVSAFESRLESIDTYARRINHSVGFIQLELSSIESDVSSVKWDVGSVKSAVDSVTSDIDSIESEVIAIKQDVSSIESDVRRAINDGF